MLKPLEKQKNLLLNQPDNTPFINVYRLEDADNFQFGNYQRYDFYQVIWFMLVGGDTSYFLDFNEYRLQDNQIILVFPGQIDKLDVGGKKGYLFAIHSDVFFRISQHIHSDYLYGYYSNVFINIDQPTKGILGNLMKLIEIEYTNRNNVQLMESYMEAFLFHVTSLFENTDTYKSKNDSQVSLLMKWIDNNFIKERETDFYADKMNISNKKINEISIKGTGKTVKQHLQERLILEIKKEIRLNRKTFKEISFDLGFSEPAYFTRFFKKHTGMTPSGFKEK